MINVIRQFKMRDRIYHHYKEIKKSPSQRDGTNRPAAQKRAACSRRTSYHPPSLSFIIPAPFQRLRPGRFAFIPTERVCHLSRLRRAGM